MAPSFALPALLARAAEAAPLKNNDGTNGSTDKQTLVIGVNAAFIIFTFLIVGIRTYTRHYIVNALGLDDVLIAIGTVFSFGESIAIIISVQHGLGAHTWDQDLEHFIPYMQATFSTRILYIVGLGIIKASLLVFYLRLSQQRRFKYLIYFLLFVIITITISSVIVVSVACVPISMLWDNTIKGTCMQPSHIQMFYNANGMLNILTDIIIYIAPIPMIWGIKLPKRQRLSIIGIFALGLIAVVASCVRFAYVDLLEDSTDPNYTLADALDWCAIEMYVAIMCASIPSFKPFLRKYAPRLLGSTGGPSGHEISADPSSRGYRMKPVRGSAIIHESDGLGLVPGRSKNRTSCRGRDALTGLDNESEEMMVVPEGVIMTTTEMKMEVHHRSDGANLTDSESIGDCVGSSDCKVVEFAKR